MKHTLFFLGLLLIFLPFRLRAISQPLSSITQFRQTQTATVAANYYKNGITLLSSELDIFGKGRERYLLLEFPLYEASVAVLYNIFFVSDMWGRAVSVASGFIGGWFLYRIVYLVTRRLRLSVLAAFFFFSVPLSMYHQKDFLMEAFLLAFLLGGLYYSLSWINTNRVIYFILGSLLMSIGFVQKGMYGPFYMIPLIWYFLHARKNSQRFTLNAIRFTFLLLIPMVALFLWQLHMNRTNIANGQWYFSSTNKGLVEWNTGVWQDRISLPLWSFRIRNLINGIFLKPGLALFVIGLLFLRRIPNFRFFAVWLTAEAAYFLLFFRIQSHNYYQMVMIPPIAVVMGHATLEIGRMLSRRRITGAAITALICCVFLWRSFLSSDWDRGANQAWLTRLLQVGRTVPSNTWGIFVQPGHDWNSVYTYFPKLKLKVVGAEDVDEKNIHRWKDEGYAYIVLHEYEKYPGYLEYVSPGHSLEFIEKYPKMLTLEDYKIYSLTQ